MGSPPTTGEHDLARDALLRTLGALLREIAANGSNRSTCRVGTGNAPTGGN